MRMRRPINTETLLDQMIHFKADSTRFEAIKVSIKSNLSIMFETDRFTILQEAFCDDLKSLATSDLSSRLDFELGRFLCEKVWTHEELL